MATQLIKAGKALLIAFLGKLVFDLVYHMIVLVNIRGETLSPVVYWTTGFTIVFLVSFIVLQFENYEYPSLTIGVISALLFAGFLSTYFGTLGGGYIFTTHLLHAVGYYAASVIVLRSFK